MANSKVSLTISINTFLPLPPKIESEFVQQGARKLCAKNGEYLAWRVRAAAGGQRMMDYEPTFQSYVLGEGVSVHGEVFQGN